MMGRTDIIAAIWAERDRQQAKFGNRSISGPLPLDTKFRILGEEVGEVAQAIDYVERSRSGESILPGYTADDALAHLRDELIQVAACAVGILEGL